MISRGCNLKLRFFQFTNIFLFVIMLVLSLISLMTMPRKERIFLDGVGYLSVFLAGAAAVLMLLLYFSRDRILAIKTKWFPVIIICIIIAVQLCLTLININPITDCYTTLNEAAAMVEKQNGILNNTTEYFERYTNNYFFTVIMYYFFRVVKIFGGNYMYSAVLLNIFCIDLCIYLAYKTAKLLSNVSRANYLLVLFALCPTTYLFLYFAYTNTYSEPFIMGIIYLGVYFAKNKSAKMYQIILFSLLTVWGTMLRPTTIIASMAVGIYMLAAHGRQVFQKKHFIKLFAAFSVIAAVTMISSGFVKGHLIDSEAKRGFPPTHWIMMGLKNDGAVNPKDVKFTRSFPTYGKKVDANLRVIKKRLKKKGMLGIIPFVVRKMYLVWTNGTNDYFVYNSTHDNPSDIYENIYGDTNEGLMLYSQAYRVVTLIMITLFLYMLWKSKKIKAEHIFVLAMLGIILFQAGWEVNKKHSICYVPLMLVMMECGFNSLGEIVTAIRSKVGKKHKKTIQKVLVCSVAVLFAAMDIFILSGWNTYTGKENEFEFFSFFRSENRLKKISDVANRKRVVRQSFVSDKKFNRVGVRFVPTGKKSDAKYIITLSKCAKAHGKNALAEYNSQSDTVCERLEVTADKLSRDGWEYLKYKGSPGSYTIKIECPDAKSDSLDLFYVVGGEIPAYHNAGLNINGRSCRGTIDFNVFMKNKRVYTNHILYGFSLIIWILLQIYCIRGLLRRM